MVEGSPFHVQVLYWSGRDMKRDPFIFCPFALVFVENGSVLGWWYNFFIIFFFFFVLYMALWIFGFFTKGGLPLNRPRLINGRERIGTRGQMLELSLLHQPKQIPGKLIQLVHRNVQDLQCSQSPNRFGNAREFVVSQAQDFEIFQVEEVTCVKGRQRVV